MSHSLLISTNTSCYSHSPRVFVLSHLSPARMFKRDSVVVDHPPSEDTSGALCLDCKQDTTPVKRPEQLGNNSNSQSTLFSHSSKRSAQTADDDHDSDSEDISDISDISEEEDDFYDSDSDDVSEVPDNSSRRSGSFVPRKPSKSPSLVRGFNPAEPGSAERTDPAKQVTPKSSTHLPLRLNIFFIANSPSPSVSTEHSNRGHLSSLFRRLKRENTSSLSRPDDDSEWVSVSSEDEPAVERHHSLNFHKRDLSHSLTGSLTDVLTPHNSTDTIPSALLSKPRSLLSGLFLSEMAATPQRRSANPKPMLKRSSTTGIITVDQGINRDPNAAKRLSILFSKKYNSLLNLSKNYPHYQNQQVKKNILNDYSDNEEDDHVLGKQKLIVGISDINVTRSSNSINSNERKEGLATSPHDALSSSLTKYTGSLHGHSLKNILSKSSLSLSGLFNSRQKSHKNGNLDQQRVPVGEITTTMKEEPEDQPPESNSIKSPCTVKSSSDSPATESSAKSFPILLDSSNGAAPRAAGTKLSPKLTRRSMLSTELSKSLKDSIIIDYKLGKVPLPPKVVRSEQVDVDDEYIENDYHSKGW